MCEDPPDQKLILQPALRCDVFEAGPELDLGNPLQQELQFVRYKRTPEKDFRQCTCGLRDSYLQPVGQTLRFLKGRSRDGKAPGDQPAASRSILLPLELMDLEQRDKYTKIRGVACWWCCHTFKGCPVGCPMAHRRMRPPRKRSRGCGLAVKQLELERDVFVFHGYFCSYSCARAYGETFFPPHLKQNIGIILHRIIRSIVLRHNQGTPPGYPIPRIRAAKHFSMLKMFGGPWSIDQFRDYSELDNGNELTVVPDWLNVIPSGMVAYEAPMLERSFAVEYNVQVAAAKMRKLRPPVRNWPSQRRFPQHRRVSGRRKLLHQQPRENAIQQCIQGRLR